MKKEEELTQIDASAPSFHSLTFQYLVTQGTAIAIPTLFDHFLLNTNTGFSITKRGLGGSWLLRPFVSVWHSLTCVTNQIWSTWGSALAQMSHTALCRSGGTYLSREVAQIPPRKEGRFCAAVIIIHPRVAILWCWSIPQIQFTLICFTPTCESQSAALKVQGNWELSNQRKKNSP